MGVSRVGVGERREREEWESNSRGRLRGPHGREERREGKRGKRGMRKGRW